MVLKDLIIFLGNYIFFISVNRNIHAQIFTNLTFYLLIRRNTQLKDKLQSEITESQIFYINSENISKIKEFWKDREVYQKEYQKNKFSELVKKMNDFKARMDKNPQTIGETPNSVELIPFLSNPVHYLLRN